MVDDQLHPDSRPVEEQLADLRHRIDSLDGELLQLLNDRARLAQAVGEVKKLDGLKARGITGTGVVAAVALGLESGLVKLPHIVTPDKMLHFQDRISFSERDLTEAGKAMGAK